MRVCLVLLLLLLNACGDRGARRAPSAAPSFVHDPASGETRARIATGQGTAELRSGARMPVSLPPGFSLYPGASVISNTVVERDGARHMLLVFETPDPFAEVMAFHRGQAEAAGVVLTLDLGGLEQTSIGGPLPSGGKLSITARQGPTGTRVEFAHN